MKRAWFQDNDGTYYRNCPLIRHEADAALRKVAGRRYDPLRIAALERGLRSEGKRDD